MSDLWQKSSIRHSGFGFNSMPLLLQRNFHARLHARSTKTSPYSLYATKILKKMDS
jgi:hypothetical protein